MAPCNATSNRVGLCGHGGLHDGIRVTSAVEEDCGGPQIGVKVAVGHCRVWIITRQWLRVRVGLVQAEEDDDSVVAELKVFEVDLDRRDALKDLGVVVVYILGQGSA
jgi:hypothetical protein